MGKELTIEDLTNDFCELWAMKLFELHERDGLKEVSIEPQLNPKEKR